MRRVEPWPAPLGPWRSLVAEHRLFVVPGGRFGVASRAAAPTGDCVQKPLEPPLAFEPASVAWPIDRPAASLHVAEFAADAPLVAVAVSPAVVGDRPLWRQPVVVNQPVGEPSTRIAARLLWGCWVARAAPLRGLLTDF